jgi:8-oxo-dGTP pyrophosphatase MutT (NUDIX family)
MISHQKPIAQLMDGASYLYPVSVKGVVIDSGRVALLKNERDEWELPGGKLELREDPRSCVEREISEELGWSVRADTLLDCWQYEVKAGTIVLIVTYGCHRLGDEALTISDEHAASGLFLFHEVSDLTIPPGYCTSIKSWYEELAR